MIKQIKHSIMLQSREKKYCEFISLTRPSKDSTLLDVGVADKEYSPFDNYLEKKYPYPNKITALSIHPLNQFREKYPMICAFTYKGGKFPFREKQFDIVFSNAVIEHVGDFDKQLYFIKELNRVSQQFYFTTPAKEFPIEVHTLYPFIHWLNKDIFNKTVSFLGKGWAAGSYMNLLRKKDLLKLMTSLRIAEYKIMTHRLGPFPMQYAVWGKG